MILASTPRAIHRRVLSAVALSVVVTALHGQIEFVGVLATPEVTRFALAETATGRTGWVTKGRAFAGYTVGPYDAKTDTLTLTRDGGDLKLRLNDSKVKSARFELTGAITFGAADKLEIERATLVFDQENVFPLKDGLTYRITPTRRDDGTVRYDIAIDRRLAENKTEKVSAPAIVALPGRPFSLQIGEFRFAFTPR